MGRRRVEVAAIASLGLAASCREPGPREVPRPYPVVEVRASIAPAPRFGTPTAVELSAGHDVTDAMAVEVRFLALRDRPALTWAAPLDHRARAITDPLAGEVRLAPALAASGLFLDDEAVEQLLARFEGASPATLLEGAPLADVGAALPAAITVRIACFSERPAAGGASAPSREALQLFLRRGHGPAADDERLELAVELATRAPAPPPPEPPSDRPPPPPAERRPIVSLAVSPRAREAGHDELLELAGRPRATRERLGLLVPSPFEWSPGWILVLVELGPAPRARDPGAWRHERAMVQLVSDLAAERARGASRPPRLADGEEPAPRADLAGISSAIAHWPRRGLVELAERTGAGVTLDAALEASGAQLEAIVRSVEHALARRTTRAAVATALDSIPGPAVERARTLRWDIDLATLEVILADTDAERWRPLLEERFGVAFEGEGDSGTRRLARAHAAGDVAALRRLVLTRNLVALEDPRPALRIVAARWLAARHPDLEGYDPLGSFEDRRDAIERLWTRLAPESQGDEP